MTHPGIPQKVIDALQTEFSKEVPYVPGGVFKAPTAYRKNLSGVLDTARLVLWNIEKK